MSVCEDINIGHQLYRPVYSDKPVLVVKAKQVFVGKDKGKYIGNSLLLKENDTRYTYIGSEIYAFNSSEPKLTQRLGTATSFMQ